MQPRAQLDEVKTVLKPYEAELTRFFLAAWAQWWGNPERTRLYSRTRATLFHNYLMIEAIPALKSHPEIHVMEHHETAKFMVDQRVMFRLKKGNEKGLSSNIWTQTALAFVNQSAPLFPDLPELMRIDIAYVLNRLHTKIDQILVVARHKKQVLWSYAIYGGGAAMEESVPPVVFPIDPRTPPPADSGLRILGADQDTKKKSGSN